jgi:hypothetical protein
MLMMMMMEKKKASNDMSFLSDSFVSSNKQKTRNKKLQIKTVVINVPFQKNERYFYLMGILFRQGTLHNITT